MTRSRSESSPEKCLGGSVKDLVLSLSFGPHTGTQSLLSATFDASIVSGDANIRQLQDLLCFKAVWLDRIEQMVPLPASTIPIESTPAKATATQKGILITAVVARIQEVRLTCILGQSIGTVEVTASQLLGRLRLVPKHSRSFSANLEGLRAASKGRLAGHFSTTGIYFENMLQDVQSNPATGIHSCVTLRILIGHTSSSLEFDYRRIFLVQADPIRIGALDDWSSLYEGGKDLKLNFSLRFGSFSMMATSQTVPTLVRLAQDLERLIEDRSAKARSALFTGTDPIPQVTAQDKSVEASQDTKEAILDRSTVPSTIPSGTRVIGNIDLEAERLRLAIFLHHFTDAEAFRADAGAVQAQLERGVVEDGTISRNLHLHLGFFGIRKLRAKKVSPAQERDYTFEEWLEHLRTAQERNIFKLPTSEARMMSEQKRDSNKIEHRFSTAFTGQVDISLNYALLKQLGEVVNAYKEGMQRTREAGVAKTAPSTPMVSDLATLPPTSSADECEAKDKSAPSHLSATSIPPPQAHDIINTLEYIALENHIELPQLQLLGDATPPLEWLGVQRGHFPAWVHEGTLLSPQRQHVPVLIEKSSAFPGVTVILEQILQELSAVYEKSLAHNASVNA